MSTKQFQFTGAQFTATISATAGTPGAVLTVTNIVGALSSGQTVVGITPPNNTVGQQLSGPTGGTGTYQMNSLAQTPFTTNATGATYSSFGPASTATASTPFNNSQFVSNEPYANGTVAAWMGPTGGTAATATVNVLGSVDGGVHSMSLGSFLLTGAGNMNTFVLPAPYNAYDSIALQLSAISGTGATVGGAVRYAAAARASA
jgi:hypothetical protein